MTTAVSVIMIYQVKIEMSIGLGIEYFFTVYVVIFHERVV